MKAVSSPLARAIAAARSSADTSRPQARKSVQPETPDGASPMKNRRSEEHTSELQSLMRISYAVFCLKKKKNTNKKKHLSTTVNTNYVTDRISTPQSIKNN